MDNRNDSGTVVVEREFSAAPDKLWRALTQPHLIAEWLMQNDFVPEVGRRFTLRAKPVEGWNGIISCEVREVEPPRTLSYTWVSGEGPLAIQTVVTLSLTPTATGTRLRMEQSGFAPGAAQNFQGAKYGWQHFLNALDQLLDRVD